MKHHDETPCGGKSLFGQHFYIVVHHWMKPGQTLTQGKNLEAGADAVFSNVKPAKIFEKYHLKSSKSSWPQRTWTKFARVFSLRLRRSKMFICLPCGFLHGMASTLKLVFSVLSISTWTPDLQCSLSQSMVSIYLQLLGCSSMWRPRNQGSSNPWPHNLNKRQTLQAGYSLTVG